MDECYYESALAEIKNSGPRQGLLAMAFAEAGGNERVAEALYLKLRAAQLMEQDQTRSRRERRRTWAVAAILLLIVGTALSLAA